MRVWRRDLEERIQKLHSLTVAKKEGKEYQTVGQATVVWLQFF